MRFVAAISATALCLCVAAASEAAPPTIELSAFLSDANGPVSGPVRLGVRIYDADSEGVLVWENEPVANMVVNGLATLSLGSDDNRLDATVFAGQRRYLQLSINGEDLLPRLQIHSVPYAIRAGSAAHADHAKTADRAMTAATADNRFTPEEARSAMRGWTVEVDVNSCSWTDATALDAHFTTVCPANKAIVGVESLHENSREDRWFRFRCCSLRIR